MENKKSVQTTLKESVYKALDAIKKWSTAKELYNYMVENRLYLGQSKTPSESVSAALVRAYQNNEIDYRKRNKTVGEYGKKEWDTEDDVTTNTDPKKESFHERDLHQLLCNYLWSKGEYPKTIYQERSSSKSDSAQKWIHPDIVSASFVQMRNNTSEDLLRAIKTNEAMVLCSYELKIRIKTDYDLKQAFFQALSNSNWANFGYLVAFEITEEKDVVDEMERLNQSFGIGIIQLGVTPQLTKVLFPARKKDLDFKTLDKLSAINEDFRDFVEQVTKVLTAEKKYRNDVKATLQNICDEELKEISKIESYCKQKNIPFTES